jgi:hypothetical protein
VIAFLGAFYFYLFVHLVPPVSARLVDAITGKPVSAMNICLQVDSGAMGSQEQVRKELRQSNAAGEFSFSPSVHHILLLQTWEGYSIRVTDPQTNFAAPCGPNLGPGLNEVYPGQTKERKITNTGYFPVVLVKPAMSAPNESGLTDTRRRMGFPLGMRVALIPILSDPARCKEVQEPWLVKDCQRLNSEAKAMSGN